MAGDWIKMRCNLDTDPRVLKIAAGLSIPELQVIGLLWKFWSWADAHTTCNAVSVTEPLLDRITCAGFSEQMRLCGWLKTSDEGIELPNFEEHNGKTAKARALTNERVKKSRENCNAVSVTKALPEKRREEKRRENTTAKLSDSEWLAHIKASPAYAGIDIEREIAKGQNWANEHRRPASRKFLVNWLNRVERPIGAVGIQAELIATSKDSVRKTGWGEGGEHL